MKQNEGQRQNERNARLKRMKERGVKLPWEKEEDYVFPTTHEEYSKNSIHGTDPRDNPFGGEAKHHGGA